MGLVLGLGLGVATCLRLSMASKFVNCAPDGRLPLQQDQSEPGDPRTLHVPPLPWICGHHLIVSPPEYTIWQQQGKHISTHAFGREFLSLTCLCL